MLLCVGEASHIWRINDTISLKTQSEQLNIDSSRLNSFIVLLKAGIVVSFLHSFFCFRLHGISESSERLPSAMKQPHSLKPISCHCIITSTDYWWARRGRVRRHDDWRWRFLGNGNPGAGARCMWVWQFGVSAGPCTRSGLYMELSGHTHLR